MKSDVVVLLLISIIFFPGAWLVGLILGGFFWKIVLFAIAFYGSVYAFLKLKYKD